VIRRLATTDNTFGGDPSVFKRLFVVDHGLADGVKAGIATRVADLPPVEFMIDPQSVIDKKKGCATVKENGALIYLGPIRRARSDKVTVRGRLFVACLAGGSATYVLKPAVRRWRIAGIIGGQAIS
jgi:hypothetical protein